MVSCTSSHFLGSSGLSGRYRMNLAIKLIDNRWKWKLIDGTSMIFSDIVLKLGTTVLSVAADIEVAVAFLKKHPRVYFVDEKSISWIPGSCVCKSNIVGSKSTPWKAEEIMSGLNLNPIDFGIKLDFPISTPNDYEMLFASKINKAVSSCGPIIYRGEELVCCLPCPGYDKADLIMITRSGTEYRKSYVSHKLSRHPGDFQQWGGLSPVAGDRVHHNKIVTNVVNVISGYNPGDRRSFHFYDGSADAIDLGMCSMFGVDYDSKDPGPNNVETIFFGMPENPSDTMDYFNHPNNQINKSGFQFGDLEPGLMPTISLRPSRGRVVNLHGFYLPNTRISVSPAHTFGT